eukprot:5844775-Pyramimonas_sp.AAC.1
MESSRVGAGAPPVSSFTATVGWRADGTNVRLLSLGQVRVREELRAALEANERATMELTQHREEGAVRERELEEVRRPRPICIPRGSGG